VSELHRADGRMLRVVTQADVSALRELRRVPPESFVVKAADGKTDLYGVLYKPYDFDPSRNYPVIDFIYQAPG
jgi:dipeptidyl-peptidase-4